jgi:hypothetical protein
VDVAGISDTSPEAEEVLREIWRTMPFERKWRQMGVLYHTGKLLHAAGMRARDPNVSPEEIHADWLAQAGIELVAPLRRAPAMLGSEEAILVVHHVVSVLDRLQIAYALAGSWASSFHGKMRTTHDADVCVEPFVGKEDAFCSALGEDYYVSVDAVRQAIQTHRTFNVIYTLTGFKVDLFVAKPRLYDRSLLARRQPGLLPASFGPPVQIVSAEDVILLKLEWYGLGDESSQTQWNDILGVFDRQGAALDQAYLDRWAEALGVADLLKRARQESAPATNA